MYSVILMMALTSGSATPDWHHRGGCYGCYGGCYGCCGGLGGCCGGYYSGCCGGYYGGGYDGGYDGFGCWGGYSSWTPGYACHPTMGVPGGYDWMNGAAVPETGTGAEELGIPKSKKNGDKDTMAPTRAKLIVEVPSGARLFIDDMPVKVPAGVQNFQTPALEPGRDYYYVVRVETMRDGQPVSETRRIIVHAGQVARADFRELRPEAVRTAQAR
jgi:uncharacterized protein (TIGR03000 family)